MKRTVSSATARLCLVMLLLLPAYLVRAQHTSFRLEIDSTSNEYRVVEVSTSGPNRARKAADDVRISVVRNAVRPATSVDVRLQFSEAIDLNLLTFLSFHLSPGCVDGSCTFGGSYSVFMSPKIVDFDNRKVDFTFDGLHPAGSYQLRTLLWGLDGSPCGSEHDYYTHFTTEAATPSNRKMLIIIDKDLESSTAITDALSQYMQDVQRTDSDILFEKYYINNNLSEKEALYRHIQTLYYQENLSYLFFVGSNAAFSVINTSYYNNNQEAYTYWFSSFAYYTKVRYNDYQYDPVRREYNSKRYLDLCYRAPQEIRNPVFQSNIAAISMGMIVPDYFYDQQTKTNSILGYFRKLHQYRNHEFDFDRKVLLTDAFASEKPVVDLIKQNGHWVSADSVKVGHVKNSYYSGEDWVWKDDYLNKIQTGSYEVLAYNGHGASTYHDFGIYSSDVQNISSLDVQFIDFMSCEVGYYQSAGYLANLYLEKGKVLGVHAYSSKVGGVSINGLSFLHALFNTYGSLHYLSKGYAISDAHRYQDGYLDSEMILGDPLLTLRKQSDLVVESQTSGNWHSPATWRYGRIPTRNDQVRIRPGHTVTLDGVGEVKQLDVEGELTILEAGQLQY